VPRTARRRLSRLATLAVLCFTVLVPPAFGQTEAESLSTSFRKAAKRVLPSVVTVRPVGPFVAEGAVEPFVTLPEPPGLIDLRVPGMAVPVPPRERGGSGVVVDAAKGLVLTNLHVVDGTTRIVVILPDGRERPVKSIRRDPKSDLALLGVEPGGLVQAAWGDPDALDIGDWVLAVGQPFGLSDTVTAGIVSGKGRGVGLALYEDLIQTDAAINPGNSGGPLVNLKGEVVGINTALKTVGGGYEGVGFAVPASRARRVASDLAEFGRVRRSFLGINVRRADAATLERLKVPGATIITGVAAVSPAMAADLRPGDVLLKIEGKPVVGPGPLQAMVEVASVGKPLTLTIERDRQVRDLKVTPRSQPDRFGLPEPQPGAGPQQQRDASR
jgi:serine protease Do